MHTAAVIILLFSVADATFPSQLMKPSGQSFRKIPSVPSGLLQQGIRTSSPYYHGFPYRFPFASERSFEAAAKAAAAEASAEESSEPGPQGAAVSAPMMNLYGESLEMCKRNKDERYCTYTEESPQICAWTADSKGFSASDGPCMSIWSLGSKGAAKDWVFGSGDFRVTCAAISSDVLESEYTREEWENCELFSKEYSDGRVLELDKGFKAVSNVKTYVSEKPSARCARFRKAIQAMCSICSDQAPSANGKQALQNKCAGFVEAPVGAAALFA